MRRETMILLLAGLTVAEPAAAQGFSWLFGEPSPTRRAPRSTRPRRMPVDIPLPVPRPHFPGDVEPPAEIASVPEPPPSGTQPEAEPGAASTPPMPPERPAQVDLQPPAPPPAAAPIGKPVEGSGATPAGPTDIAKSAPLAANARSISSGAAPTPPMPPAKPADLGTPTGIPASSAVAPSGATTAFDPREPALDPGCADRLAARGVLVEATTLPPQPDARCTVVQPMHLVSAKLEDGATVSFPDKPTIACTTADAFSAYVHDLLAPLARGTWGVGLTSVWTGPGLECRSRDHIFGAKLSAHGQGLAVDIAQLKLGDGRLVAVGEPKTDTERDFETAARAGGCGYFHTVLGPGSDSYHRTHWHFDLEVRGREGDGKYCK